MRSFAAKVLCQLREKYGISLFAQLPVWGLLELTCSNQAGVKKQNKKNIKNKKHANRVTKLIRESDSYGLTW